MYSSRVKPLSWRILETVRYKWHELNCKHWGNTSFVSKLYSFQIHRLLKTEDENVMNNDNSQGFLPRSNSLIIFLSSFASFLIFSSITSFCFFLVLSSLDAPLPISTLLWHWLRREGQQRLIFVTSSSTWPVSMIGYYLSIHHKHHQELSWLDTGDYWGSPVCHKSRVSKFQLHES